MSQEHKQKASSKTEEEVEAVEPKDLQDAELSAETDELLDEIDGVLEDNAEEFLKGYIQAGGQ